MLIACGVARRLLSYRNFGIYARPVDAKVFCFWAFFFDPNTRFSGFQ